MPRCAVRHREPLGEADRGVLGDGVRRAADHRQQAGRRRGDHEAAALAVLEPARHQLAGGADVGHHVDVDDPLPDLVGGLQAVESAAPSMPALAKKTSIRPSALGRGVDQRAHAVGRTSVARDRRSADLGGHRAAASGVEVVDDDAGALGGHPGGQRAADAAAGAGDDGPGTSQYFWGEVLHDPTLARVMAGRRAAVRYDFVGELGMLMGQRAFLPGVAMDGNHGAPGAGQGAGRG